MKTKSLLLLAAFIPTLVFAQNNYQTQFLTDKNQDPAKSPTKPAGNPGQSFGFAPASTDPAKSPTKPAGNPGQSFGFAPASTDSGVTGGNVGSGGKGGTGAAGGNANDLKPPAPPK